MKFFKAVVPGGRAPIETPATFDEFLQRGGIDPNVINQLPDGDYLKSTLTRKFNESRRFAEQVLLRLVLVLRPVRQFASQWHATTLRD